MSKHYYYTLSCQKEVSFFVCCATLRLYPMYHILQHFWCNKLSIEGGKRNVALFEQQLIEKDESKIVAKKIQNCTKVSGGVLLYYFCVGLRRQESSPWSHCHDLCSLLSIVRIQQIYRKTVKVNYLRDFKIEWGETFSTNKIILTFPTKVHSLCGQAQ